MYLYLNEIGRYGDFGGKFVLEILMQLLEEIEIVFKEIKDDFVFCNEYYKLLYDYFGRLIVFMFVD